MSNGHAPLAPSGAYQWAPEDGCRGAVRMQALYPEDGESEKAREGTAAHFYVTEALEGRIVAVGDLAPNGHPIDVEMVDAGAEFIEAVRKVAARTEGALRIETRLTISEVHEQCWGTPDAFLVDRAAKQVWVWDYKYGHRYVDIYRNWQLLLYAIGVLEREDVDEWDDWTITLGVGQPRNYHPSGHMRSWTITGPELMTYWERLTRSANEATAPDAPLRTGSHCRDCTARHACPALLESAMLGVEISKESTPLDLTPRAMGIELTYLAAAEERIKARRSALEEQILGKLRGGDDVPFWRADYSSGRERWKMPATEVIALGDLLGVDVRKPAETITPAQARAAGMLEGVVRANSEKPRGSLKLIPVTDEAVSRRFG